MTVHGVSTNRRLPRDPSPLNRAAALAGFPMLIVDLPEAITAPVPFTREALENILGGRPTRSQNHAVKYYRIQSHADITANLSFASNY